LGLTTYARNKAADFINQKEKEYQKAKTILILFLISSITASLIVSFLTFRHNKNAQKNLTSSEKKYRSLVETQTDLVSRFNNKGEFTFVNEVFCKFFNKTRDELLGGTWQPLPYEEDVEYVQSQLALLSKENPTIIIENRLYSGTGDIHWMQFINKGFYDNFGNFQEIQSVGRDITEQKRTEIALISSEERHKMLFKLSSDAILLVGLDNLRLLDANEAAINLYGYSYKEILQMKATHLSAEKQKTRKAIQKSHDTSVPVRFHKKKDGTVFPTEIAASVFEYQGQDVHIAAIRDITERMRLEAHSRRFQKMESLGLLAGGVAHDLNNILSGIVSYPELILMDLPEDSKLRKPIETIQDSGHRAAAIVEDLLTIARGVATTKEILNLNELINSYLKSPEFHKLQQSHPAVAIHTDLDPSLLNLSGSNVHLRKVIMNLVSNASEAIEGSGNVTVSTENRYIDKSLKGYADVKINEYVVLTVSDDGSGIASDEMERIFEPFYSKKIMGRSGTGLGLAVVWNVVQNHEGYIDVKSDANGTSFELYFPIVREEITDSKTPASIQEYKGNGETILVVDDVESQREISCKMLDILEYKAKSVSSGEEAVEYLKENTVDLILLDMIMDPGINGRETYEQIISIHPNQKAIIVSGFAETDEVKETQKLGAGQYIKKPFALEMIGLAVKEELEK
ncbi:MAG: PAS domain S-box protein, partial [Desulfobacterales bacterium]|nr:PAS domain S-box protein [Desulfobacterales bacterium]MDX2509153.1 PAS domain S-box protein [Desulfobacterales bacterium]